MAADQRRPTGEHPDPEILLAYHEHALGEADADRVQEHLVHCDECAQAVLDFAAFPDLEPPSEEHRVTPLELRRRWRDLQAAIARRRRPWWQRHQVLLPLAAAFFAAAVGLGVWSAGLNERVAELEGPRGDVQVLAELRPIDQVSRGGEAVVRLRPEAHRQVIVLSLASSERYPQYRLTIEDAFGRAVTADRDVRRAPEGNFTIELPSEILPPGRYHLELFGEGLGAPESVAVYRLLVEP